MKPFLIPKVASVTLLIATLVLALLKAPKESAQNPNLPPDRILRVSFDYISIGGRARCRIRYDADIGVEFLASVWGSERARVAMDESFHWFWIKDYDSKRHYEMPLEAVAESNLIPILRPSFLVWIINDHKTSDSTMFTDGDYEVELKMRAGSVAEQIYRRGGTTEVKVTINAFQESSGRKFPALATLEMNGELINIDMGPADTLTPIKPNTDPPFWSELVQVEP